MRNRAQQRAGFTIMELIVAAMISAFMMTAFTVLFNEVTGLVRRGTQTGEIIQRARAIDQQLSAELAVEMVGDEDEAKMVGPLGKDGVTNGEPGGFLVIRQGLTMAPLTADDVDAGIARPFRIDQVAFILDNSVEVTNGQRALRPLAPGAGNLSIAFTENALETTEPYVRIWYGFVLAKQADGSDPTAALGIPAVGNPNSYAADWVLGRHALFLTGSVSPDPVWMQWPLGRHVNGYGGGDAVEEQGGGATGFDLREGITDVSNATLRDLTNDDTTGGLTEGVFHDTSQTADAVAYQDRIYQNFIFPETPVAGLLTQLEPAPNVAMTPERLAPMHTAFMQNVSDFAVEWAGDVYTANSDGVIPAATLTAATAYNPDGLLDRAPNGEIIWYGHYFNNGEQGHYSGGAADTNQPYVWQPPGGDPTTDPFKPYRVWNPTTGEAVFVFQHAGSPEGPQDTGANAWPWMLRIRYRLQDAAGEYVGRRYIDAAGNEVVEPGQWYQTIVPVNHQTGSL